MSTWRRFSGWLIYKALPSRVAVSILAIPCAFRGHRFSDFFGYMSCDQCGKEAPDDPR